MDLMHNFKNFYAVKIMNFNYVKFFMQAICRIFTIFEVNYFEDSIL